MFPEDSGAWKQSTRLIAAAKWAESMGWQPLPLYHPDSLLTCSCGNKNCVSPGKHPRLKKWTELKSVKGDFARWFRNRANIGIRTGEGLLVLDIDPKNGGDLSIANLQEQYETLPDTLTCVTGGGGLHFYFTVKERISVSAGRVADGVDIRCDGGLVVAPPSRHASGSEYYWDVGQPDKPVPAPLWLVNLCKDASKVEVTTQAGKPTYVVAGGRNDYLCKLAGVYRNKGVTPEAIEAMLLVENKQRCMPPLEDAEVIQIAQSVGKYKPKDDKADWGGQLNKTTKGTIKSTAGNAAVYLLCHPLWQKVLGYNELRDKVTFIGDPPQGMFKPKMGDDLSDDHYVYIHHWMSQNTGVDFALHSTIRPAVRAVARQNTFDPLTDYIDGLVWDGVPRVDRWLQTYANATDNKVTRLMGRWWLISAIARALKPGCQADHILVLEGPEAAGKTSLARVMGGEFYLGNLPKLSGDYVGLHLQGYWIVEAGELTGLRGVTPEKLKDFASRAVDVYKRPYDTETTSRPRRFVMVATTNQREYLEDSENRRIWPCWVGAVDLDKLKEDRDQIWAEAKNLYHEGAEWWPTALDQRLLSKEQNMRIEPDAWEEPLVRFLISKSMEAFVTVADLMFQLGFERQHITKRSQMRVGQIMRKIGWMPSRQKRGGAFTRGYVPLPAWERYLENIP